MKLFIGIGAILCLTGCSYKSIIVNNRARNGNITNELSLLQKNLEKSSGMSSILNESVPLDNLLQRRILDNSHGSFFAILIDSVKDRYLELKELEHSRDSIRYNIIQYNLRKTDSFRVEITLQLSDMIEKKFFSTSFNSYQLMIKFNFDDDKRDSVLTKSFEITKAENFIIQKDVLELLTGEISNEKGIKFKYVALNDPHDIDESLTGLCLITMPNYAQLELDCKRKALNVCKSGVADYKVVTKTRYLFFKDCYCQVDCKH